MNTKTTILKSLLSLLLLTLVGKSTVIAQNILICAASPYKTDIKTKLDATGKFTSVTIFDAAASTPTLAQLQAYDAVMVLSDNSFNDPTALGDNLASYIDGGGGVVNAVFSNASIPVLGNFNTNTYLVIVPASQTQGTTKTLGTVHLPSHPTMAGVTSFNGGSSSYISTSTTMAPGSYRVADYASGEFLIVARDDAGTAANKTRVDINFYPPSSDIRSDFWDVSTNGSLIMANALLYTIGQPAALDFDGTNDFADQGTTSLLNFGKADAITIESWVKSDIGSGNLQQVYSKIDGTFTGYGLQLQGGRAEMYLIGNYGINDALWIRSNYSTDLRDGKWHHIAGVYDGSNTLTNMKVYIDGVDYGSTSVGAASMTADCLNGAKAEIGASDYAGATAEFMNGQLDELRIWNVARTASQIQSNMHCELPAQSGLVALYHLNNGIPNGANGLNATAKDESGNAINGALINFALTGTSSNWVAPKLGQEINVTGNSANIADGSSTPTLSNFTKFSNGLLTRTYTIENKGPAPLTIGGITITGTHATEFAVTTAPATTIAVAGSTTFTITFTPGGNGTRTATINIANTDCDEATYNFNISADAILAPTPVTASPAIICAGGSSNLNATATGAKIKWYTSPSGGSPIGYSLSGANFSVSPAVTTTYYAESFTGVGGTKEYFLPLSSIIGAPNNCGGGIQYGYGGVGFDWTDSLSGTITAVTIDLAVGVECDPVAKTTTLNGVSQPSFNTNYECTCSPNTSTNGLTTITLNPNDYLVGALNQFRVTNANTFGYMTNSSINNYYAKITVTYNDTLSSSTRTPVIVTVGCDGNGVAFDGINDVITVAGGGGLNNQQSGTIEMWVKWNGLQDPSYMSSSFGAVMARQSNSVFSNQIIALTTNDPATARVVWNPYSYAGTAITSTSIVGDGNWNHIAIVYSSGNHSMYINGTLEGTSVMTGTINNDASKPLTIGAWIGDGNGYSKSVIDEVRIWNSMRTQTQIQNNMNCDIAQDINLKAYFRLNHGTAGGTNAGVNGVFDYSGNGNCGVLNNSALTGSVSNWVVAKTPYCVTLGTCDGNSAKPTLIGNYTSSYSSTDVNGYRHFCDCQSNLLLALKPGGTGAEIPDNGIQLNVTSTGATFYPNGTGFVVNGLGWSALDRTWNVNPTTQPSSQIPVRFYFNDNDVTSLNNSLTANGLSTISGPDLMSFYKVTNPIKPAHASIPSLIPGDIVDIMNGPSVTDSTWIKGILGGGNYYAEFAVNSFSGGGGGAGPSGISPLPVELLYLTAKAVDNNHIKLDWATASESNSNYFEVQRSLNGIHYTPIDNVKAAGNSSQELLYSLNDFNVEQNVTYFYRLNMVDLNGSHEYSNVVLGRLNSNASANSGVVTMYPNPAKTELNIVWPQGTETADVVIRSVEGKTLLTQRVDATHKSVIGLQHLLPGIYTVSLNINGEIQNQKLIIQK